MGRRGAWGGLNSRGGSHLRRHATARMLVASGPALETCPECGAQVTYQPREERGFLVPGSRVPTCTKCPWRGT